ncbi:MAG: hypothetical protein KatS3mg121_1315 [Gammaproteobacteria bacterium]|nr:MAG: hypothetical protein KatS3mg121_1315 [Gammaproteobacteria bacterium]
MSTVYPVKPEIAARAWVDEARYREWYRRSIEDPEGFWAEQGRIIDWIRPYTRIKDVSFDADDLHIRWYEDGT